jgi:hypothetical protein
MTAVVLGVLALVLIAVTVVTAGLVRQQPTHLSGWSRPPD